MVRAIYFKKGLSILTHDSEPANSDIINQEINQIRTREQEAAIIGSRSIQNNLLLPIDNYLKFFNQKN